MVCQYSREHPLSSENHQSSQERSDEPVAVGTRATSSARTATAVRVMTCGRLYAEDTLLERLAHDLEDVAAARRQLIQQEHAAVR
jgi:hypothetical protein